MFYLHDLNDGSFNQRIWGMIEWIEIDHNAFYCIKSYDGFEHVLNGIIVVNSEHFVNTG